MGSTNQGPEYFTAEKGYLSAKSPEEQIFWLEEMMRNFKKHKGSEGMLANLRQRLKKIQEKQEKAKKSGKSSHKTIKKEGFQIVLLGLPSSGKSSLLSTMTNAKSPASPYGFTTKEPIVGTLDYEGIKAQVIDLPSIGSDAFDSGLIHTADLILIVLDKLQDLDKISAIVKRSSGKQLIVITKADLLSDNEIRKLQETIKSRKLPAIVISSYSQFNLPELKEKILSLMNVVRIYFKEPNKPVSKIPMVARSNSTVQQIGEKIYKGFSSKVKETRVTGPSSKFPNQKVGLSHILKDKDIVEFHTS